MPNTSMQRRSFRRVHILPSLLTLGNFACGFFSIVFCLNALFYATRAQLMEAHDIEPASHVAESAVVIDGENEQDVPPTEVLMTRASQRGSSARAMMMFHWACVIIFFGMAFDMLDGKIARQLGAASAFGTELDSLADVTTFGVAPPVIVTTLWISAMPLSASWWGQVMIFGVIYAACGVLRLARYNIQSGTADKNVFSGLPIPAAAGCVVTSVLLAQGDYFFVAAVCEWIADVIGMGLTAVQIKVRLLALFLLIPGLLMVSTVPYVHVANRYLSGKKSYTILVVALLLLALIWHEPRIMLFLVFNGYLVVGLINWLRQRWKNPPTDADELAVPDDEDEFIESVERA